MVPKSSMQNLFCNYFRLSFSSPPWGSLPPITVVTHVLQKASAATPPSGLAMLSSCCSPTSGPDVLTGAGEGGKRRVAMTVMVALVEALNEKLPVCWLLCCFSFFLGWICFNFLFMSQILLLSLFYRGGNWGLRLVRNLPREIEVGSGTARRKPSSPRTLSEKSLFVISPIIRAIC